MTNEMYSDFPRVTPRDFFNESKLLKCMGFLSLAELNKTNPSGLAIKVVLIDEEDDRFNIVYNNKHDMLEVKNYQVYINDVPFVCGTIYNSKQLFPLYIEYKEELIKVFEESGVFTEDFIKLFINITE